MSNSAQFPPKNTSEGVSQLGYFNDVVPDDRDEEKYDESFSALQLIAQYLYLGLVTLVLAVGIVVVRIIPGHTLDYFGSSYTFTPLPQKLSLMMDIVIFITVLSMIVWWVRTYWVWRHTRLKANASVVVIEREAKFLLGVWPKVWRVQTKKIDAFNFEKNGFETLLQKFGVDVSTIVIDTPAREDKKFNNLQYVKNVPDLQRIVSPG
jgi:hypothetical protein